LTTARARQLRATMANAEVRLWSRLKKLRAQGYHFRRQAPFRGYYLDFVCMGRRLVIELDGGHHGEDDQALHDLVRDRVLKKEGFEVLRFWNRSLDENMTGVMEMILATLDHGEGPTRLASRSTLPIKGREGA